MPWASVSMLRHSAQSPYPELPPTSFENQSSWALAPLPSMPAIIGRCSPSASFFQFLLFALYCSRTAVVEKFAPLSCPMSLSATALSSLFGAFLVWWSTMEKKLVRGSDRNISLSLIVALAHSRSCYSLLSTGFSFYPHAACVALLKHRPAQRRWNWR